MPCTVNTSPRLVKLPRDFCIEMFRVIWIQGALPLYRDPAWDTHTGHQSAFCSGIGNSTGTKQREYTHDFRPCASHIIPVRMSGEGGQGQYPGCSWVAAVTQPSAPQNSSWESSSKPLRETGNCSWHHQPQEHPNCWPRANQRSSPVSVDRGSMCRVILNISNNFIEEVKKHSSETFLSLEVL